MHRNSTMASVSLSNEENLLPKPPNFSKLRTSNSVCTHLLSLSDQVTLLTTRLMLKWSTYIWVQFRHHLGFVSSPPQLGAEWLNLAATNNVDTTSAATACGCTVVAYINFCHRLRHYVTYEKNTTLVTHVLEHGVADCWGMLSHLSMDQSTMLW